MACLPPGAVLGIRATRQHIIHHRTVELQFLTSSAKVTSLSQCRLGAGFPHDQRVTGGVTPDQGCGVCSRGLQDGVDQAVRPSAAFVLTRKLTYISTGWDLSLKVSVP